MLSLRESMASSAFRRSTKGFGELWLLQKDHQTRRFGGMDLFQGVRAKAMLVQDCQHWET